MLDGDDCRHAVAHVRAGKIGVLILQDAKLSRIGINNSRKHRLKTGDVCSALRVENIITEAQNILMKFVRVLERRLGGNALSLSLKIHDIMQNFRALVEILHKPLDAFRLVVDDMLGLLPSPVLIDDRKLRV